MKPTRRTNFPNLLQYETLHVSDSFSAHHQEFIHCTLGNGICHTGFKTAFEQDQDDPVRKQVAVCPNCCLQSYRMNACTPYQSGPCVVQAFLGCRYCSPSVSNSFQCMHVSTRF